MEGTSTLTLSGLFAWLMRVLFDAVVCEARRKGVSHKLEAAICWRANGLYKRLRSVFARWDAGRLGPPRPRAPRVAEAVRPAGGHAATPRASAPPQEWREWRRLIPGRFGWLRQLLGPRTAGACNGFIEHLGGAEMAAILAAAPQVGRILRPFYRCLGIELPAELRLAKRRRQKEKGTSPRPSPQGGEGEEEHVAHPPPRPSPSRGRLSGT